MDAAREYIVTVMEQLERLIHTPTPYAISSLSFDENTAPPVINWAYGDITHDVPVKLGHIATENQDLLVRVWHAGADQDESETNTRALKNNLLVAARIAAQTKYAGTFAIGTFRWSEEEHTNLGRWLEGSITIPLPVPNEVFDFVTIETVSAPGVLKSVTAEGGTEGCDVELPLPPLP